MASSNLPRWPRTAAAWWANGFFRATDVSVKPWIAEVGSAMGTPGFASR
jgi:hypothetical protein